MNPWADLEMYATSAALDQRCRQNPSMRAGSSTARCEQDGEVANAVELMSRLSASPVVEHV
jgi:hypothetical protein